MLSRIFIFFTLFLFLYSCSKDEQIYQPSTLIDPYELYKDGMDAFENNDFFFASKKFSEAELNFKEVDLAAKSAIMSSFSLYGINFYDEATENLERYLKNTRQIKMLFMLNIFWQ